ncbi:MAG: C10 family peptidase [Prevotella sp.]|nr:C10 family peptidase [Prevotella sp.]
MKRFALFFSLFMLCLVVKANPVSRSQALKEAKSFLATKGVEMNTSEAAYRAPRKANAQESESSYYYIFNVGNDEGFVIVSGDDRTEQILGYSDSGSFDEENMPEPLKEWLDGYAKEMESIIEVDANEYESLSPRRAQEKTKKSIAPLTTSKWGTGVPYFLKTPIVNGKHCPCGCGPIAVAQYLYYYKNYNYQQTTHQFDSTIPLNTKFNWNLMLDEYVFNNYSNAQRDAIANFMYYVGCTMGASYSRSGTTASIGAQLTALRDYFGYNANMTFIDRPYYSNEDWDYLIYNELLNKRPVLYNAFSDNSGHTFIVDGYDNNGLFHINWGWKGYYNGFFRLSVLNRYESGYKTSIEPSTSYTQDHSILIYATPKSWGDTNCSNNLLSAKFTSVSSNIINCTYINQSGKKADYYFGLGCVINDEVKFIKQLSGRVSLTNQSTTPVSFKLSTYDFINLGIENGRYRVVPLFKTANDLEWRTAQFNKDYFFMVDVASQSVSFYKQSNINLKFSKIEYIGDSVKTIKATIANISNVSGYSGQIYFFISNSNSTLGSSLLSSGACVNIGKNDVATIKIPYSATTGTTYYVTASTDSKGSSKIGQLSFKYTKSSLKISGVGYGDTKNFAGTVNGYSRVIWGNTISFNLNNIKNPTSLPVSTKFIVWLRQYDNTSDTKWNVSGQYDKYGSSSGDNARYYYINVTVPAKCDNYLVPILFEGLKFYTKYEVLVQFASDYTLVKKVSPFILLPGVTTWKADGTSTSVAPTSTVTIGSDVVAVDITDATDVTKITPNSNPNILYYLGANQKVPTGLTNKNVVKGDVAEKITLVDNKNFFVPKRFTAKSINFTTQPTKGVSRGNNNNWTTIALPFEVTSVMNTTDNEEIDWFHSDIDTGKNFWIRKFDRLDKSDNTVIFENAEKMLAYEPYIMNVPDDYWGKKWDLRNKNITFYGENAVLHNEANIGTNSSYYNFVGTTLTKNIDNGWLLNDAGDTFKYVISGTKGTSTIVSPFHAYFMLTSDFYDGSSTNSAKSSLRIKFDGDEDSTTGIMAPFAADEKVVDVYNLNGVKVASKNLKNGSVDMSDLPKGIYVVNGKKFIQY